jgi:hypothetical protein
MTEFYVLTNKNYKLWNLYEIRKDHLPFECKVANKFSYFSENKV